MTLKETRKRTGLDLISDKELCYYDRSGVPTNVRESQHENEKLYPRHKQIRLSAMRFFFERGFEIYPRGLAVSGTLASPDFAIFKGTRITFVECLTERFVYPEKIKQKERITKHAPIIFVAEDKPKEEFNSYFPKDYHNYKQELKRLARKRTFYLFVPATGKIKRYKS